MTGTQLATDIRRRTGTSSATLSDSVLLPIVNFIKDEIVSRITEKDENHFIIPATQNLVASSVTAREYALPDDVLNNLVSVEAAFTSGTPLAYVNVPEIPFSQAMKITGGITEANIINNFDNSFPFFYRQRRSIYLLSGAITAITSGLKIRYRAYPTDLANLTGTSPLHYDPTTITFGIPLQFHRLWAMKCAIEWKQGRPKPLPLSEEEKQWDVEMENRLAEMKKGNLMEEFTGMFPNTTREGNNGADL